MTCLSRLIPGQTIKPHRDFHDNGCRVRIHAPLVSNEHCVIRCGADKSIMLPGFLYAIDPTEEHETVNNGKTDRIHLFWNMVGI